MKATVLVPTHDHGPTLLRSVGSALAQTVDDIEVLIVGDGVPDSARPVIAELLERDERVRFFDHPKGPRNGEAYRNAVLADAKGDVVCYLSDDDLWLPEHVESMRGLLADADFAHGLPLRVEPSGEIGGWTVDLSLAAYRDLLMLGTNRIPLQCAAHTMEAFRRLPFGWRTTPVGTATDLYMWQQFLASGAFRLVSATRATTIHFPSSRRRDWTLDQRLAELDEWVARIADPAGREQFHLDVFDWVVRDRAVRGAELERATHARSLRFGPSGRILHPLAGDWSATGADTVGVYEAASGAVHLSDVAEFGAAWRAFAFGPGGLSPIAGDWDGDGIDSIGLYDASAGVFYLKNAHESGLCDLVVEFGAAGRAWVPLSGDWEGRGSDSIGLYDPATGAVYLRASLAAASQVCEFAVGPGGQNWIPLAGDWDGDGVDSIGLYDPAHGVFHLKNSNASGRAELVFHFGPVGYGWVPIAGNWNGMKRDNVGLYDPEKGKFYLQVG